MFRWTRHLSDSLWIIKHFLKPYKQFQRQRDQRCWQKLSLLYVMLWFYRIVFVIIPRNWKIFIEGIMNVRKRLKIITFFNEILLVLKTNVKTFYFHYTTYMNLILPPHWCEWYHIWKYRYNNSNSHIPSLIKICTINKNTELSKYYACIQMAVARGLRLPAGRLAGHQTDAASEHSLCYFSLFSEYMVTCIDVHLQNGNISVYWLWLLRFVTCLDRNSHCVNMCIFTICIWEALRLSAGQMHVTIYSENKLK